MIEFYAIKILPNKNKTRTKGDVIVEDIKIGDIHFEFEYGYYTQSEVISLPQRDEKGYWKWTAKNTLTGEVINYGVTEGLSHYGPNLYTYMAYHGCKQI